jgi:NADPH:quinone reductase-like Zn-dependent oxidoreductase
MSSNGFPITLPPDPRRFDLSIPPGTLNSPPALPASMKAVVTRSGGGYERLDYCDVPVPRPLPGTVLIKVRAAGVNNTEVNTRLGWYSASVDQGTNDNSDSSPGDAPGDGGWADPTPFPFIQGTDCCGEVVASGGSGPAPGTRVLVRPCMRTAGFSGDDTVWMGSDFDGAFAQYLLAPAADAFPVDCDWSDAELGSIPCAYGTAENMLHRAAVKAGETVLVKGASGGVGSAALQLALRRGARVIAVTSAGKRDAVAELGAHQVVDRGADLLELLGEQSVDVVVDNVAGEAFIENLGLLRRRGRVVSSGAIAGPLVQADMRDLYLKDLSIIGSTAWDEPVFSNLISYIEKNEIRPLVCAEFPLEDIVEAQKLLLERKHVGKIVLIPPA